MKWIVSEEAEKKRKEKGDKRKLKKYWRFVLPNDYVDDMIDDKNEDSNETGNDGF